MSDGVITEQPLAGLTVLDFTWALSGPFGTLMLAGLGARVIKVEHPDGSEISRTNAPYLGRDGVKLARENADDMSLAVLTRARNKLGITLNLKHPEARGIVAELAAQADVVVENFTAGTMERLGFGYEVLKAVNPRLVYCSITGFGQDGGSGRAVDPVIQALSGLMMTSGGPDDPPVRVGVTMGDLVGGLYGVIGILAAVQQAQRTGSGQYVDVGMLGALTALVAAEPWDALELAGIPVRTGRIVGRLGLFGVYPAADGWVSIATSSDQQAWSIFRAMGQPELIDDERFHGRDGRVRNGEVLREIVDAWSRTLSADAIVALLEPLGVPVARVRTPVEATHDPRMLDQGATERLVHPEYGDVADVVGSGIPIRFSGAVVGLDQPAPHAGQHNTLVYSELLGYSVERIAALKRDGVV